MMAIHRPDQTDALFDLAIVEHQRGCWNLHRGAAGAVIDQQLRAWIVKVRKGIGK
jgi:hypothetical protein